MNEKKTLLKVSVLRHLKTLQAVDVLYGHNFFQFQGRIEGGANPVYISIFFTFSENPHDIFKKKNRPAWRGAGGGLWERASTFQ